ncbi:MAG TPA: uracil-DNA glycosylase family protein [Candidatus Tectomicrobia bacterium]|nr:uracil-DNA glycosylase family protein [Candidatus Tectomicrobia bacterium]
MRDDDYEQLVAHRKHCHACKGMINPSEVDGGRFDSAQIGPWSRWQGNLSAELMVVGQDWGDEGYFRQGEGWDRATNPTNRTLMKLLESIGILIGPPTPGSSPNVLFFTNAVLCLKKEGGLQGGVQRDWFKNCSYFLRRQIEIVTPRVVAALGAHAFRAVRDAFGLGPKSLADAVADLEGDVLLRSTRLLAVYHCGARVLNTHRPLEVQLKDWARIGRVLRADPSSYSAG